MKRFLFLLIICLGCWSGNLKAQYQFYEEENLVDLSETIFGEITEFKIIQEVIFISDYKHVKIHKFSLDGKRVYSFGRQGRGPGEFEYGPRYFTASGESLFVSSMMPFVQVYTMDLEFLRQKRFIDFASNIHGLHNLDSDKIIIVPTQFYEESLFIYDIESEEKESIFLNFEIAPGLLSKYDTYPFGDKWLFAWEFQNRFELYDSTFSKISSFKLPGIPEKADGKYSDFGVIPKEANSYRAKMYKKGTFFPYGTFFTSIIKLDEEHLLVQLGIQTGGDEKAIIVDFKGKVKQEVELPQKRSIILAYHNDILYMQDRKTQSVFAYEFKK